MTHTYEHLERALEEATGLLGDDPAEGTPAHDRLLSLMQDVASYHPVLRETAAPREPETERLAHRLDAFEAKLPPTFRSHWQGMVGGDLDAH